MNGRRSVGMDGRKTRMDWRRTGRRELGMGRRTVMDWRRSGMDGRRTRRDGRMHLMHVVSLKNMPVKVKKILKIGHLCTEEQDKQPEGCRTPKILSVERGQPACDRV